MGSIPTFSSPSLSEQQRGRQDAHQWHGSDNDLLIGEDAGCPLHISTTPAGRCTAAAPPAQAASAAPPQIWRPRRTSITPMLRTGPARRTAQAITCRGGRSAVRAKEIILPYQGSLGTVEGGEIPSVSTDDSPSPRAGRRCDISDANKYVGFQSSQGRRWTVGQGAKRRAKAFPSPRNLLSKSLVTSPGHPFNVSHPKGHGAPDLTHCLPGGVLKASLSPPLTAVTLFLSSSLCISVESQKYPQQRNSISDRMRFSLIR
ncbi:hypothetical protein NQZ68_001130 [Dissostichus eleginoides]|nr:hypothetical protein NQZ68_001130 [Dissostichus eleginoides]